MDAEAERSEVTWMLKSSNRTGRSDTGRLVVRESCFEDKALMCVEPER